MIGEEMSIGSQQVKQFKEQGYTSSATFFNEREIRAMRAELGRGHDRLEAARP